MPISLYGIAQYFGWDPWIAKRGYHIGEGIWTIVRPPGTLGYVSYFAGYLVFAVFLAAALYSMEERGWWKIAGASAAALSSFAIVLSGTRELSSRYSWAPCIFGLVWPPCAERLCSLPELWRRSRCFITHPEAGCCAAGPLVRRGREGRRTPVALARFADARRSPRLAGSGPETFLLRIPPRPIHRAFEGLSRFLSRVGSQHSAGRANGARCTRLAALLAAIALGIYQARTNQGTLAGVLCLFLSPVCSPIDLWYSPHDRSLLLSHPSNAGRSG